MGSLIRWYWRELVLIPYFWIAERQINPCNPDAAYVSFRLRELRKERFQ